MEYNYVVGFKETKKRSITSEQEFIKVIGNVLVGISALIDSVLLESNKKKKLLS